MSESAPGLLRCDTCGRATATVKRVVVDAGYNRADARPLYNCPECYAAKLRERTGEDRPLASTGENAPQG